MSESAEKKSEEADEEAAEDAAAEAADAADEAAAARAERPVDVDAEALAIDDELSAPAPDRGDELEGEGQDRLVGIMYSEKQWVVPEVWKVGFLLCAVAAVGGLLWFSVAKRMELRRLQMDSVVEPTPVIDPRTKKNIDAPDFVLPEGDSNQGVKLSDLKGRWVLLNFWATWCPPCRDEMPSMEMLNRRFQDKGLVMLAVSVDEDWSEVNRFFGDTAPSFKVLWDKRKVTARRWGTSKFPETYLVNPEGKVAAKFIGPRDWYNIGTVEYFEGVLNAKRDPA